jgi:enoyl-CoA hydratase/carnithine racemase
MAERKVQVTAEGGVVAIDLPGGVLDAPVASELIDVCAELRERRDAHVVLLRSGDRQGHTPAATPAVAVGTDPAEALASLVQIVVASVEGRCTGAAFELLLAADLRVAGSAATFELRDACDGRLPAWGGASRLTAAAGRSVASRMLLLGEVLDSAEAVSAGVVTHVAAPGQTASARARELVDVLCTRAPLALELAKEAVRRGSEMAMRDALGLEADLNLLLRASDDRREGIDAFLQKRAPLFRGR